MCRSSTVKWQKLNYRYFCYKVTLRLSRWCSSGGAPTSVKPWSFDRCRFYESFGVCKILKFPSYDPFPRTKKNINNSILTNFPPSADPIVILHPASNFLPSRIPATKMGSSRIPPGCPANLMLEPLQRYSGHKFTLCCHDSWTLLNNFGGFLTIANYNWQFFFSRVHRVLL